MACIFTILSSTRSDNSRSHFRKITWLLFILASVLRLTKLMADRGDVHHPDRSTCLFVAGITANGLETECEVVLRCRFPWRLLRARPVSNRPKLACVFVSFSSSL